MSTQKDDYVRRPPGWLAGHPVTPKEAWKRERSKPNFWDAEDCEACAEVYDFPCEFHASHSGDYPEAMGWRP